MSKIADDAEAIARRLKELEADRQLALTGSTVEEKPAEKPQEFDSYGMYMMGYQQNNQYNQSLAHPAWPYAGTAHEWRGFVQGVGNGNGTFNPPRYADRVKASG